MIARFLGSIGLFIFAVVILSQRGKVDTFRMLEGMKSAARRIKLTSKGRG